MDCIWLVVYVLPSADVRTGSYWTFLIGSKQKAAEFEQAPLLIAINGQSGYSSSEATESQPSSVVATPPNSNISSSTNSNNPMETITQELKELNKKMDIFNNRLIDMNDRMIDMNDQMINMNHKLFSVQKMMFGVMVSFIKCYIQK